MRQTTKLVHYHKYERMQWPSGTIFYKCMQPNCPHYLPIADLVIGRESLCWGHECNKLVLITKEDIAKKILHPMCEECKEKRALRRDELRSV